MKFEQEYVRCVRNEKECVCSSVCLSTSNIIAIIFKWFIPIVCEKYNKEYQRYHARPEDGLIDKGRNM